MNVDYTLLNRRSSPFCFGNNKRYDLQLNYFSQFIQAYNIDSKICANQNEKVDRPVFALNWLSEISHDWLTQLSSIDDDLNNFFIKMNDELKDSFLFIFSDHGHRFAQIRQTTIGRIEEQMPFFSMHVPQWLTNKYPILWHILNKNSNVNFLYF